MAALTCALREMDTGLQYCWILRELQGLPYKEIAQVTRASEPTVRGRLFRARRLLKRRWPHGARRSEAQPSEPPRNPGRPDDPAFRDAVPLAGDQVLPCGRLLTQAWEQAQDGMPAADAHATSCPHCREAVEGLARLSVATRALRAKDPPGLRHSPTAS
ncbi:hypothetical protein E4K10_48640 [Streptomyces sp. T1317-0309]|nr:hypothetical protein E4K10_48640 [Streptomyces sp. T1317-0309]